MQERGVVHKTVRQPPRESHAAKQTELGLPSCGHALDNALVAASPFGRHRYREETHKRNKSGLDRDTHMHVRGRRDAVHGPAGPSTGSTTKKKKESKRKQV